MVMCHVTGEWMVPVNRDSVREAPPSQDQPAEVKKEEEPEKKEIPAEPKGDPEMAPVYIKMLLPVFTQVYQGTMLPSVRLVPLVTCRFVSKHFQIENVLKIPIVSLPFNWK